MRKLAVILIVVPGLCLTGCQNTIVASRPLPVPTPVIEHVKMEDLTLDNDFYLSANNKLTPDTVTVEINDHYFGAVAEWNMYVHCGDGIKSALLRIKTEPNEETADIPLDATLLNGSFGDILALQSGNGNETLKVIAYDKELREMTITGFIPDSERIVRVTYRALTPFRVYYSLRDKPTPGYEFAPEELASLITFSTESFKLMPFETRTVVGKITIPLGTRIKPGKYVFWIDAVERINTGVFNGNIGGKQRVFVVIN